MCINDSKTEVMWIGNDTNVTVLRINNIEIPFIKNNKALGITISNNLSWECHMPPM